MKFTHRKIVENVYLGSLRGLRVTENPGVCSCEIENQGHKPKYMLKTVLIFAKMCTSLGLYSRRENRF